MAQKKIDIKFNVDDKSVKIAGEETMKLSQQVRLLKAELASGKYSQEEFELLASKLGEVEDRMAKAKARSGDLFTSLQLIPGPVGEIASKINGAIALMKQFGDFSFADLKFQFKETLDDVKDIGASLGRNLGITQTYTKLNEFLTTTFTRLGIAQQSAAAGARAFAGALTATGIGAIVVALGLLIAYWDDVVDAIKGATTESKAYEEAQADVTKGLADFNRKLIDVDNAFKQAKAGTISKEDALKKYNETLGSTVGFAGSLEQAEQLLAANTSVVVEGIKLRTQANVFYAKSAEAAAKAVSGEDIDPSVWQTVGDFILAGGQAIQFANNQVGTYAKNLTEVQKQAKVFEKEGDELTKKAIDNDQKLKKGLAKPPETNAVKQAAKSTIEEYNKAYQEVTLSQMTEKEREEALVKEKFANFIKLAKENGKETKTFEDALAKELSDIKTKYEKKDNQTAFDEQVKQLELKKKTGVIKEEEYQKALLDLSIKYNIRKEEAQANYTTFLNAETQKRQNKERELLFIGLQDQIDVIDKANELLENDFLDDNARLEEKRLLLQQQRDLELQAVENDEVKRLEIIKKYADAESAIDKQVTENKKTELLARETAQLQFASAIGDALGALSGLLKEGSDAAKAAALAEIAIGTGVGFINALRIAQQSAQGSGPAAAFAFPIFYASQVAAILSAASRAKAILKSGSGSPGGGNTPEPPAAPAPAAPTGIRARRNQGGFVFGDGGSITDSIPAMLSNGEFVMNAKSSSMFSPMLTAMNNMGNLPNTAIPQSLGNQSLVDVMSQGMNNRPIKTYVTAQDMSNQQQFDRTIKSRSLI
jgi:hypothetical protein